MRPVALGRKNYLFAGSELGAEAAAILYSLTESCRRLGIHPNAYLVDVFGKLATVHPKDGDAIRAPTPARWIAAQHAFSTYSSGVSEGRGLGHHGVAGVHTPLLESNRSRVPQDQTRPRGRSCSEAWVQLQAGPETRCRDQAAAAVTAKSTTFLHAHRTCSCDVADPRRRKQIKQIVRHLHLSTPGETGVAVTRATPSPLAWRRPNRRSRAPYRAR